MNIFSSRSSEQEEVAWWWKAENTKDALLKKLNTQRSFQESFHHKLFQSEHWAELTAAHEKSFHVSRGLELCLLMAACGVAIEGET